MLVHDGVCSRDGSNLSDGAFDEPLHPQQTGNRVYQENLASILPGESSQHSDFEKISSILDFTYHS